MKVPRFILERKTLNAPRHRCIHSEVCNFTIFLLSFFPPFPFQTLTYLFSQIHPQGQITVMIIIIFPFQDTHFPIHQYVQHHRLHCSTCIKFTERNYERTKRELSVGPEILRSSKRLSKNDSFKFAHWFIQLHFRLGQSEVQMLLT